MLQAKALKADRTREWYRANVGYFRAWLVANDHSPILAHVTSEVVHGYVAAEAGRRVRLRYRQSWNAESKAYERICIQMPGRLSEHSLNSRIRALRAFGRWLVRNGWLAANPFATLELAGAPKLRKQVLSEDEINRLFSVLNEQTDIGARDRAILWLFLDTGVRLSELASLTMRNVNLRDEDDGPWIQVIGKDRKERRIGLSQGARQAVRHYVEFFRPPWVRFPQARVRELERRGIRVVDEPLFLTVHVHGLDRASGQQLLPNAVQLIVSRLGKRAGFKTLSCHTFRRTFATQNLELGASPLDIMWDLGHSSLTMTNHYASLADQNRMSRHRQFSYMERIARSGKAEPVRKGRDQI
jgi:site-specific recombinase XerD